MQQKPQIIKDGCLNILFDPELVESPSADLFNVDHLKGQGVLESTVGGRGASFIVRMPYKVWVLRHYRRGGLVGKVLHDQYFGLSRDKCRSWSEWQLLYQLHNEGFPVPRPVAATYQPCFGFYRAALVTEFLPGTKTLAEKLTSGQLESDTWEKIGICIGRFHQRGVYHADLNAHNIMLGEKDDVFLLDFDKGAILELGRWQGENIRRLKRSLTKLLSERDDFSFSQHDWFSLLAGYKSTTE